MKITLHTESVQINFDNILLYLITIFALLIKAVALTVPYAAALLLSISKKVSSDAYFNLLKKYSNKITNISYSIVKTKAKQIQKRIHATASLYTSPTGTTVLKVCYLH